MSTKQLPQPYLSREQYLAQTKRRLDAQHPGKRGGKK